ncbi:MAG: LpxD N-terminal domain-containing protein [bacterium]|nr:LpxD N-terminal domain-containing protein [bacterium]
MLTVAQLANSFDGVWHGNADHAIYGISSLSRANSKEIAYFDHPLLLSMLQSTRAEVLLLKAPFQTTCPVNSIVVTNPRAVMLSVTSFVPANTFVSTIHPTAQIHYSVHLGNHATVGAYAVIGEGVQLADQVVLGAHSVIEPEVVIGYKTQIGSHTHIHSKSHIGKLGVIGAGCVIGGSPFNYLKEHGTWQQGLTVGGVFFLSCEYFSRCIDWKKHGCCMLCSNWRSCGNRC